MRESRSLGSVRGGLGNRHSYGNTLRARCLGKITPNDQDPVKDPECNVIFWPKSQNGILSRSKYADILVCCMHLLERIFFVKNGMFGGDLLISSWAA